MLLWSVLEPFLHTINLRQSRPCQTLKQFWCFRAVIVCVLITSFTLSVNPAQSQLPATTIEAEREVLPIRTDSPRATFESFRWLSRIMETEILEYLENPTFSGATRIALVSDQLIALFDLQEVSPTSRREVGILTASHVMDILGRLTSSSALDFPNAEEVEASGIQSFRVPETPIRIVEIAEGERKGEFLFSGRTVRDAPRFARAISHLPLQTRLPTNSIAIFGKQLTGPLVPSFVVSSIPKPLTLLWLDTPIWKTLVLFIVFAALIVLIFSLNSIIWAVDPQKRMLALILQSLLPLSLLFAGEILLPYLTGQINISGRFAAIVQTAETILAYIGYAWLLWLAIRMVFELIIRSPRIPDESLDADMLRLLSATLGIIGVMTVMAFGGQAIGIPILSIMAGLGIGGIAVALAVRPTLENLIGGVILYIDRPVKIGDFCSFGDHTGTVERVGIRSTKLRTLDRTLISMPNAQFADMQIINWAECDQMLIDVSIGVRYETTPDQLRYLLAQLRKMCLSHPRIDRETVRVRFSGYGDSSLNISIRVYAQTREWNDFFAIREDVLLRVYDVVGQAGTGFAFPSQTLYVARDKGVNTAESEAAEAAVASWRKSGKLPFPNPAREEVDQLQGTLDYPPTGSVEAGHREAETSANMEPLSNAEQQSLNSDPTEDERK